MPIRLFQLTAATAMLAMSTIMMMPNGTLADGLPVTSVAPSVVPGTGVTAYGTRSAPIVSSPVIGYGPAPDFAPIYDTSRTRPVVTEPVAGVSGTGEDRTIEYNSEAGATAPHVAPNSARPAVTPQDLTSHQDLMQSRP